MNKTDRIIVAALFLLLIGWSFLGKKFAPKPEPDVAPPAQVADQDPTTTPQPPPASPANSTGTVSTVTTAPLEPVVEPLPQPPVPEQTLGIGSDSLQLVFSSWGGGITMAELSSYDATMDAEDGPVAFDFSKRPALTYDGLPGLSRMNVFELKALPDGRGIVITGTTEAGMSLKRLATLGDGYLLTLVDTFTNEADEPAALPASRMNMGEMGSVATKASTRGISYLGVDSLSDLDGARVTYWTKAIPKLFGVSGGCSRPNLTGAPVSATQKIEGPLAWVSVKNKFFTQLLKPSGASEALIYAARDGDAARFSLASVAASVEFPETLLQPGERFERQTEYYVGPKKYSELRVLGNKEHHIMLRAWRGWGWWRAACAGLLWLLNGLWFLTRNYGIAIILLTIIVKVVFWPLTHKGTENMKRMQKLQPQLTKLREKYKDSPKKLQEKQMLLYRENGVNPLAGCLPMFVQMPVFIALFTVLRSAVELRFASFLWIADLSEPEGLLAGVLPFPAGGLNLLPLAMTGTMIIQQRLTPSAGDPQQQKMMQFMPVMMLFIFYNMSSALVLYWTVSQLLSILQLVMQQRKEKAATA